jgi:hypothetical protein
MNSKRKKKTIMMTFSENNHDNILKKIITSLYNKIKNKYNLIK